MSAKNEGRKSRSSEATEREFRRVVSLSDGATLSDQSEASPAQDRRDREKERAGAKKTKAKGDEREDGNRGEKKPRRFFLSLLLSKSKDQEEPPKSPTEKDEPKRKQQAQKPTVRFRSKTPKSSEKKKYTAEELDNRRSMYDEFAPLVEGMLREDKTKKDALQERIEAVAPPPAKAPNTALLPPKATSKK